MTDLADEFASYGPFGKAAFCTIATLGALYMVFSAAPRHLGFRSDLFSARAETRIASYEPASTPVDHALRFQSSAVQQLAQYVVRNVSREHLDAMLQEIDADKNMLITETEVLSYVRNH